ncbi:hypothetical protein BO70DRAFT_357489 [Aspergillus heteromorphus CBS 117.55]|uniref:Uncharacterized protein n=1 Tax=Aspergillus heteromorphus CBS 117.55 TaxID=1448321 RepID=A0A317X2J2_9EURO|nr:uncharacterized protein BO70DRAFT_357489 [Aspergillus heteromorphus CBS 117.55]PWY92371.1 hypothetical protein BO70DRAFT_357489 [Aspergillus heteromorphus CBS 117.55]
MSHQLSIEVFGTGEDPNHRSHWGFMIHRPPNRTGDLLHVRLLDLDRLWYQFEARLGTDLLTMQAVGICKIAELSAQQRHQAIEVIKNEPAPRDGRRKCQDWVFSTLIALEVEELVPPGTSEFWKSMVGRPARGVARAVGTNWTSFGRL